jgi:hypothetical protein
MKYLLLVLLFIMIFLYNDKETFNDSCNGTKINSNTCLNKLNMNFEKNMDTYPVHHQMSNPCEEFMSDKDF